jgi:hypothetical protein
MKIWNRGFHFIFQHRCVNNPHLQKIVHKDESAKDYAKSVMQKFIGAPPLFHVLLCASPHLSNDYAR